jgi:predicted ATP-binding protein involved in virulence
MRITQISVKGLFGKFDRVIPLNMDDRITIIHAPNGYGKTVIFEMVDGFFNGNASIFYRIPFSSFKIEFYDDVKIEISSNQEATAENVKKIEPSCNLYEGDVLKISSRLSDVVRLFKRKSSSRNGFRRILNIYPPFEHPNIWAEPSWPEVERRKPCIRLIESQRLLTKSTDTSSKLVITRLSDSLAKLMQDEIGLYGSKSQVLDRTFPTRSVQRKSTLNYTNKTLREHLNRLEKKRSRLIAVGLLEESEDENFQLPEEIEDSTKGILSMYVDDTDNKLNVLNEILERLELFQGIINNKFAFSGKRISCNKDKGFLITSNNQILDPADLSSGEQNELILIYELLFEIEVGSLVLIDEPEISLHVGWQVDFLNDLQRISRLVGIDILIATHAPSIIHDRWDLTVELAGIAK